MNITSGKIASAQKIVIYGPEGIGKSSFAAKFPRPLFIDTEGSTKWMDVQRFDKPTSWTMLNSQVQYVKQNRSICDTLVIDTIDWAEQLCINDICAAYNKKGIEDFGYGNGYVYEKEAFGKFLNSLEEVVEAGIHVVLTAHAQLRKFEQPDELGAYDRWELKLGKKTGSQISPLVKEWADMVLFANYETFAVQTDDQGKKFKAQGGTRVLYTSHHPCWDAKNRCGLPDKLPFDYAQIAHCIGGTATPAPAPSPTSAAQQIASVVDETPAQAAESYSIPSYIPKALADLMRPEQVTVEEIQAAIGQRGYYPEDTPITSYEPGFVQGVLIGAWPKVFALIQSNRDLPFE